MGEEDTVIIWGGLCVFCVVSTILLPMAGTSFYWYNQIRNEWEEGYAIIGENTTQDGDYGVYSSGTITTQAYFDHEERDEYDIIWVQIQYPPPPEALNTKTEEEVKEWFKSFGEGNLAGDVAIYIDLDTEIEPGVYRAVETYMQITGWIAITVIYGLVVCAGVIFLVCAVV